MARKVFSQRVFLHIGLAALFVASMMLGGISKKGQAVFEAATPPDISSVKLAELAGPLHLDAKATRFVLATAGTAPNEASLAAKLNALPSGRHIYLVFKGLFAAEPPGTLYHVYFDLPKGAHPEKNDAHHVGSLNFFQAGRHTESGGKVADETAFRSLDVTHAAKALQTRGLLEDVTTVTIIPSVPPADGARPSIGSIELIEQ